MKHTFFTMMIANALIILALGSCTKKDTAPVDPSQQYPITINNLVASHWIKDDRGHYVCVLTGVLSRINTTNHAKEIYVIADGRSTLIKPWISINGGTLWAAITNDDLQLDFVSDNGPLPFSYLVFKIVIL